VDAEDARHFVAVDESFRGLVVVALDGAQPGHAWHSGRSRISPSVRRMLSRMNAVLVQYTIITSVVAGSLGALGYIHASPGIIG